MVLNASTLQGMLQDFLARCTVFAAAIAAILIICSSLSAFENFRTYAVLQPAHIFPAVWTIVTSSMVERSALGVILHASFVLAAVPTLQAAFDQQYVLQMMALAAAATGAGTLAAVWSSYVVMRRVSTLFYEVSGFHGVTGALLAALQQVLPKDGFACVCGFPLRPEVLSITYIAVSAVLALLNHSAITLTGTICGTLAGWWYVKRLGGAAPNGRAPVHFVPLSLQEVMHSAPRRIGTSSSVSVSGNKLYPALISKRPSTPPGRPGRDAALENVRASARRMELGKKALEKRLAGDASSRDEGDVEESISVEPNGPYRVDILPVSTQ